MTKPMIVAVDARHRAVAPAEPGAMRPAAAPPLDVGKPRARAAMPDTTHNSAP